MRMPDRVLSFVLWFLLLLVGTVAEEQLAITPRSDNEAPDSSPFLLLGSVDGHVHALAMNSENLDQEEWTNGRELWSFYTGSPLVSSYQASGFVEEGQQRGYPTIIPAVDGSLLVYTDDGVYRSSLKASQLVERVPYRASDGTLYTGSRGTTVYVLDRKDGRVLQEISGDGVRNIASRIDPTRASELLWVGKVKYTFRALDPETGKDRWNFTVSELMPLFKGQLDRGKTGSNLSKFMGGKWEHHREGSFDLTHPMISEVVSTGDGELYAKAGRGGDMSLLGVFGTPIVSGFLFRGDEGGLVQELKLRHIVNAQREEDEEKDSLAESGQLLPVSTPDTVSIGALDHGQLYGIVNTPLTTTHSIAKDRQLGGWHLARLPKKDVSGGSNKKKGKECPAHLPFCPGKRHEPQLKPSGGPSNPSVLGLPSGVISSDCTPSSPHYPACLVGVHGVQDSYAQRLPFLSNLRVLEDFRPEGGTSDDDSTAIQLSSKGNSRLIDFSVFFALSVLMFLMWLGVEWRSGVSFKVLLDRFMGWADENTSAITVASAEAERKNLLAPPTPPFQTERDEDGFLHVGRLRVSELILGYGCHGTMVYKGTLDGRPVAVKRMLKAFHQAAEREIRLLIESDGHPNVVRYFVREIAGEFVYLALELCVCSLRDFVAKLEQQRKLLLIAQTPGANDRNIPVESVNPLIRSALLQITTGVSHLHSLRIVHRDLKPHNILLALAHQDASNRKGASPPRNNAEPLESPDDLKRFVCKISDMGVGKLLASGQNSFSLSTLGMNLPKTALPDSSSSSAQAPGSVGWQAPELTALRIGLVEGGAASPQGTWKHSKAVDIFSLGCIFYNMIVPGSHPFGEWYEREANIVNGKLDLRGIEGMPDAKALLSAMLLPDPTGRPTARQVQSHPFFWDEETRLAFLIDFSDRLEQEPADSLLVLATEANAISVIGPSWDLRLHADLLEDVNKYRKYDTASVRDCLRILRNKRHHLHELPVEVQKLMWPVPKGIFRYFDQRFPQLLMHCYRVCSKFLLKEKVFKIYLGTDKDEEEEEEEEHEEPKVLEDEAKGGNAPGEAGDTTNKSEAPKRVEEEKGDRTTQDNGELISYVTVLAGSTLAESYNCRGWWRPEYHWKKRMDVPRNKQRPAHLNKAVADPKYRTRLCTHWETTAGQSCPMKKKGKCDFAHGPIELRVRENRRNKWGVHVDSYGDCNNTNASGGEDVLGNARALISGGEGSVPFQSASNNKARAPSSTERSSKSAPANRAKREGMGGEVKQIRTGDDGIEGNWRRNSGPGFQDAGFYASSPQSKPNMTPGNKQTPGMGRGVGAKRESSSIDDRGVARDLFRAAPNGKDVRTSRPPPGFENASRES